MNMKGIDPQKEEMLRSEYLRTADVLTRGTADEGDREPSEIYGELFEREFGISGLLERLKGRDNVGVILNDGNRPTPSHLVMDHLMSVDTLPGKIRKVHIATGTHEPPKEEELKKILGSHYDDLQNRVHIHNARDREGHVPYGITKRGTPLFFDRELEDHDLFIFVNSVEPHYFAGFTGGRKSLLPGMAFFGTTERNHSYSLSEGSRTLALGGNPVHEDMVEAAGMFLRGKDHISIQIVQGPGKVISDLKVGDLFSSFHEAVESAKVQFCIPVKKRYDIVVSIARPPMDRTMYQALKAVENGKLALKDGGVMVLVAECREGVGQSTFWDLLTMSSDPEEVLDEIDRGYVLGYHKAAKIVSLSRRASIIAVCSIDRKVLEKGFMEGFWDLDHAMKRAFEITGDHPDILVIPDGTVTVPILEEGSA
ncbi:MAG: nickel-dependent lactate racemase [Candidatus Thermoplasmatota archaeon]|nr:nickel-dependent lactate racemase [Candidatus Thermoplasmatota archaeon]